MSYTHHLKWLIVTATLAFPDVHTSLEWELYDLEQEISKRGEGRNAGYEGQ